MLGSLINASTIPPHINLTHVTPEDYQQMFESIRSFQGNRSEDLGLDACNVQNELDKVSAKMILSLWRRLSLVMSLLQTVTTTTHISASR